MKIKLVRVYIISILLCIINCHTHSFSTSTSNSNNNKQLEYLPIQSDNIIYSQSTKSDNEPLEFEDLESYSNNKSFNVSAAFVILAIGGLLPTIGTIILMYLENLISKVSSKRLNLKNNTKFLSIIINLSVGILICTIFVGLLPEGIENFQKSKWLSGVEDRWKKFIGALLLSGWFVVIMIYKRVASGSHHGHSNGHGHDHGDLQLNMGNSENDEKGIAENSRHFAKITRHMGLALFIHNIPEGIVIFIAIFESYKLGLVFGIAMTLHKIPEGIMLGAPAYYAYGLKWKSILIVFLSTWIPQMIGGLLGWLSTSWNYDSLLTGILFLLATAILTHTLLVSLLPLSTKYDPMDNYSTNFKLLGIIIYILLSNILD